VLVFCCSRLPMHFSNIDDFVVVFLSLGCVPNHKNVVKHKADKLTHTHTHTRTHKVAVRVSQFFFVVCIKSKQN